MKRAALVLVATLALPAALAAQTAVDQKRPAAPDASVSIENSAGSTKVTGWERAEVQVKGTVCSECELSLDGTDKRVQVEIESHHVNPMAGKSDIEVMVPAGSSVSVEGFSVTISIAGVTGGVKAETVNGTITHAGGGKDVQLQSVNGARRVREGLRPRAGRGSQRAGHGARRLGRPRGLDGERQADGGGRLVHARAPRDGQRQRALRRRRVAEGHAQRRERERQRRARLPRRLRRRLQRHDLQRLGDERARAGRAEVGRLHARRRS